MTETGTSALADIERGHRAAPEPSGGIATTSPTAKTTQNSDEARRRDVLAESLQRVAVCDRSCDEVLALCRVLA